MDKKKVDVQKTAVDVQTTVNEDSLEELIEEGEIENVYDSDEQTAE